MEHKPPRRSDLELRDILDVVRMHLGVVVTITVLAVVGTLMGHFIYLPVYDAYSRTEVKTEKKASLADIMAISNPLGMGSTGKESAKKYLHYLHSNAFHVAVAQRLKYRKLKQNLVLKSPNATSVFHKDYWSQLFKSVTKGKLEPAEVEVTDNLLISVESLTHFIRSTMAFQASGSTITIRARTLDAFTSMELVNTAANVFAEATNQHDIDGLINVENLLKDRLEKTRDKLQKVELDLIEFKKKNRAGSVDQKSRVISTRLNRIEEKIQSIRLKVDSNKNMVEFYQKQKRGQIEREIGEVDTSKYQSRFSLLTTQLERLKKQEELMLQSGVQADDWRLSEVKKKITEKRAALKTVSKQMAAVGTVFEVDVIEIDKKIQTLTDLNEQSLKEIPALEKSAASLRAELMSVPEAEQEGLMLKRNVELEYANFATLQKRLNEIEIQRISLDKKVAIEELSDLPPPIRRLSLGLKLTFSFLIGLFFSVLISFLLEFADTSVRSKSDLEEYGINFLGEIPCIYGPKKKSKPKGPEQLVCLNDAASLNSILFDFVRSRLESSRTRSGKDHVTLTVTSSQANEGKSFIASNLAVSLSRLGKKTILVDCDLRCPSIHAYFDVPNDVGLSDLFEGEVDFSQVLQKKESPLPDIITTGWAGGDPTVIFSSENFRIFMKHLRNNYDYVILDCPPVCVVPDAAILANLSDSALLVSRYRTTSRRNLSEAQQKIHQISSKQVHGVINFKLETEKIISYYPYVMPSTGVDDPTGVTKNQKTEDFKKKFESFPDEEKKRETPKRVAG